MDCTEVCQGWIYCITNKVNGKKYIGQTIDFERRKREHFTTQFTWCPLLHRAIEKYGRDNFTMEPLATFTAINRRVCVDIMNWLEIFYIKKYRTLKTQNGYNINEGGGGTLGFHHSEEMKRKLSEERKGIKKSEEFREKCRQNAHPENLGDCRKAVLLYDLEGIFRREYPGINNAIRALGLNVKAAKTQVIIALKNHRRQAYGYQWRYKENNYYPIFIEPFKDARASPVVYHYTVDGKLIEFYPCLREAAKETGIPLGTIQSSVLSTRKHKKDYWSYEAADNYEFGRKLRTR